MAGGCAHLSLNIFFICPKPPFPVPHGPCTRIVLGIQVILAYNPIHNVLDQPGIIMFHGAQVIRQLIVESPAFFIRAFQPPDQVPFFFPAGNPVYTLPAIPVFQATTAIRTNTFFPAKDKKISSSFLYSFL